MNKSKPGKVKLIFPTKGFCSQDIVGRPLFDHECDMVFLDTMREKLRDDIEIIVVEAHINDEEFSEVTIKTLLSMMKENQ